MRPESSRRVVSALLYFSRFEEHPTTNFVVDASIHVTNSLQAQSRRYFDYASQQIMKEPFGNLPTNILSDDDHRKVLDVIFEDRVHPNWQDLALSLKLAPHRQIDAFASLHTSKKMSAQVL